MKSYEIFDLFLHTFALIISGGAIIITYMAIMSAKGDNLLASTLQIANSFFSRVDQMSSNYNPQVIGSKLFIDYESDLKALIYNWDHQEKHHSPQQVKCADIGVKYAISKENSLDARFKKYVELNGAELVHYIEFFNGFIPTVEKKLDSKQLELFRSMIRSSVSMSEWKFLILFATTTENGKLMKVLTTLFPDADIRQ